MYSEIASNDIYNTSKQAIQNSTRQIIGIIIVIGGFSLIGYGYWEEKKKRIMLSEKDEKRIVDRIQREQNQREIEQMEKGESSNPKKQRENEDRFRPSNIK